MSTLIVIIYIAPLNLLCDVYWNIKMTTEEFRNIDCNKTPSNLYDVVTIFTIVAQASCELDEFIMHLDFHFKIN